MIKKILLFLGAGSALYAWAELKALRSSSFSVSDFKVMGLDRGAVRLSFILKIQNPSSVGFSVRKLWYKIGQGGRFITSGESLAPFKVYSQGNGFALLSAELNENSIKRYFAGNFGPGAKYDFEIEAAISVLGFPVRAPFAFTYTLPK